MQIKLALGGDVNFSTHRGEIADLIKRKRSPILIRGLRKLIGKWNQHLLGEYSGTEEIHQILLEEYGGLWRNPDSEIGECHDIRLPFKYIGNFFRDADIGYINLETPLSKQGRHIGAFCSSPDFALALKENNISIASVANNHSFDAGERGFIETLDTLRENDIKFVGGGMNIDEARNGEIIKIGKLKLGFLAYTALCNNNFMSLATNNQPGILPLFEPIVLDDIRRMKAKCEFLVVAPHFDIENKAYIHKNTITFAHKMVDCGADLIIGSHAHLPKPLELYEGKLIIYCLGNLIFTYSRKPWGHSLVAEIILSDSGNYAMARFYPIHGKNKQCYTPDIIHDSNCDTLLAGIKRKSEELFKTPLTSKKHFLEIKSFNG